MTRGCWCRPRCLFTQLSLLNGMAREESRAAFGERKALNHMNSIGSKELARETIDVVSGHIARGEVPSWKRILDCTLVMMSAPVWLPLGLLVAVWVKLVSPGPALFRQERVGHMGARFLCLKFRTMKLNADTTVHREHLNHLMTSNRPMKKLDSTGDSRLIPGGCGFGRWEWTSCRRSLMYCGVK